MAEWLEVAKAIGELGVLVICAALVLLIFWLNYKRGNQKDDERDDKMTTLVNKIQEQNDMLVNRIVQGVTGHNLSNEENSALSYVEKEINDSLKFLQSKVDASRVSLVRYHNGNKGMDGLSFLKMSMTNEAVKVGVQPIMQDFQNYFRSFLSYWCEGLDCNGYCLIDDIEEIKNKDANMYEYLSTRNVKSKYGIAIHNEENTVVGFICIEYMYDCKIDKIKLKKILDDYQIKIETLLNLKTM